jgi:hypothetical protein
MRWSAAGAPTTRARSWSPSAASEAIGGQPLPLDAIDQVSAIDGVDVVVPASTGLAAEMGAVSFGPPDQVFAAPAGADQGRETFVIVTHDPRVGEACDRVIRMEDGCVLDHGLGAIAAVA